MGIKFSADEIFEMAIRIEQNGANYYRAAAAQFQRIARAATLLTELAGWEEGHRIIFAALREDLRESERTKTMFDPEDETGRYLQAMADGTIFNVELEPAKRLTGKEHVVDVLRMAVGMEKDSIIFYLGLRDLVPADRGRDKVDAIIKEEMSHIGFLSRELGALKLGGEVA